MKIIIKEVKTYLVKTEDGKEVGKFERVGDWCGMTELKSIDKSLGSVVIDGAESLVDKIFGDIVGKEEKLVDVVKVSPSLANLLLNGVEL